MEGLLGIKNAAIQKARGGCCRSAIYRRRGSCWRVLAHHKLGGLKHGKLFTMIGEIGQWARHLRRR